MKRFNPIKIPLHSIEANRKLQGDINIRKSFIQAFILRIRFHSSFFILQEGDSKSRHYDAHHRHEFDEDIQRRTGSILERIAHSIAHDGSLVMLATLAAETALLDHLLRIIPGTARIGHEHSQRKSGCQSASEQT